MARHMSSCDRHVIIWTSESPADFLWLSPCVNVKLIHVDRSDRKMSLPPDLKTGVRDSKTEPVAEKLATLSSPYLYSNKTAPRFCRDTYLQLPKRLQTVTSHVALCSAANLRPNLTELHWMTARRMFASRDES